MIFQATTRFVAFSVVRLILTTVLCGAGALGLTSGSAMAAASGNVQNLTFEITTPSGFAPQIGQTNQRYVFNFSTSQTGALTAGSSTITITTASGTNLGANNCSGTSASSGQQQGLYIVYSSVLPEISDQLPCPSGNSMTFTVPFSVPAGGEVTVVDYSVTNSLIPGPHTVTVSTSADGPATASYSLSIPGFPQIGVGTTHALGSIWIVLQCYILKNVGYCP